VDANAYVITFPMLVAAMLAVAGTVLSILVKKWITDSDKAATDAAKATHESFQLLHARIDKLRDDHAEALKAQADLRVELAKAVTREEVNELRNHIDVRFQELLKAIAPRGAA